MLTIEVSPQLGCHLFCSACLVWPLGRVPKKQRGSGMDSECFFFCLIFFALDQMIVVQRVMDRHLLRGETAMLMFPCMAAACLSIRTLRTRENMILVGLLLPLSLLFAVRSELLGWLVVPLQSLAIYWILTSALATLTVTSAIPQRV
jgi:hypothetical protein